MKVIERGTLPQERLWRGTCRSCGSKVEATEGELNHIDLGDQRDGPFAWEVCPVCKAGTDTGYGGVLFYQVNP
jgi:hypothetical protein